MSDEKIISQVSLFYFFGWGGGEIVGFLVYIVCFDFAGRRCKCIRYNYMIRFFVVENDGKKLAFALLKKPIQHFALFPKLIREMSHF